MGVKLSYGSSYFYLNSWVLSNILQLAAQSFCDRFITREYDPGCRLYDQITMAARSISANIAEGTARHDTSRETEMRLIDVARGSNHELLNDLLNYLVRNDMDVWSIHDDQHQCVSRIVIDKPNYSDDLMRDVANHIKTQKAKYALWIDHQNPAVVANCMIVMCNRLNVMLSSMMDTQLQQFRDNGGFSENMTHERNAALRSAQAEADAPKCPVCGSPMVRKTCKRGSRTGKQFWSCLRYREGCHGTINID